MIVAWRGEQDRIPMVEVTKATRGKVSLVIILTISSLGPAKGAFTKAPYQCRRVLTVEINCLVSISPEEEGTRACSMAGRRLSPILRIVAHAVCTFLL